MRDLDAGSFDDAVAGGPILVDFTAPWCKPCKAIEPILEELEARIPVARLDIDEHPEIAARCHVLSVPTVTLFEGGEARESLVGARPRGHFEKAFGAWLDASAS